MGDSKIDRYGNVFCCDDCGLLLYFALVMVGTRRVIDRHCPICQAMRKFVLL